MSAANVQGITLVANDFVITGHGCGRLAMSGGRHGR